MDAPAWHPSIDPALLARLLRPLRAPGIISMAPVRRILGWVDYVAGRLPLLEDLARRRGRSGGLRVNEVPIVHGRWVRIERAEAAPMPATVRESVVMRAAPAPSAATPSAPPPEHPHPVATALPAPADAALASRTDALLPHVAPSSAGPAAASELVRRGQSAPPEPPRVASPTSHAPLSLRPEVPAPAGRAPAAPTEAEASSVPLRPLATVQPMPVQGAAVLGAHPPLPPVAEPAAWSQVPSPPIVTGQIAASELRTGSTPLVPVLPARPERSVVTPSPAIRPPTKASASPSAAPSPTLPRVVPTHSAGSAAAPQLTDALPHLRFGSARATEGPGPAPDRAASGGYESTAPGAQPVAPVAAATTYGAAPSVSAAPAPHATAAAPSAAVAVDLEILVEKVQRKLLRRLAAERERKGGFG